MRRALASLFIVAGLSTVAFAHDAMARGAHIVAATASKEAGGTWRFEVTVRSNDTGWDKYADRWEVAAPDGRVLGKRVLLHPHENEQPFTRSLTGLRVPAGVDRITIRAHDKVEGYGGKTVTVTLPE